MNGLISGFACIWIEMLGMAILSSMTPVLLSCLLLLAFTGPPLGPRGPSPARGDDLGGRVRPHRAVASGTRRVGRRAALRRARVARRPAELS